MKASTPDSSRVGSAPPAATWLHWLLLASILAALALHIVLRAFELPAIAGVQAADAPLLAVLVPGGVLLAIQMVSKLLQRDFGADFLAVIALGVGLWQGEYPAAVLILLMLTGGQVLEAYAMRRASSALRALADRMPQIARRKRGEQVEEITPAEITVGDLIIIHPHETAPVDGTVVEGNGTMDESYLTGEPFQMSKAPGAAVLSGAINGDSVLIIQADKPARDSRYAQIMKVMQEAEQKRPNLRRLGDQLGALFTPVVLCFALAVWYVTGDATRFLAVLVVATPCPLLIAIPITLVSAISMAAKRGIIIRNPVALERLPTCRTAIFDKTGTLTYGKPALTEILTAPGVAKELILQAAAGLERYSNHPLAAAILQAAAEARLPLTEAAKVSEAPGRGLTGVVDGHEIQVTHRKKLLQLTPAAAALLPPTAAGLECIILMDGEYAATFRFHDAPRADGKTFIGHLAPLHQFNKIMLVSGDRASEVAYLAESIGIKETLSSQSPEQKVAVVRAETALAPTLFLGDGINDAPALAAATVGVAFGRHSAVTAEAAGVVILENSLAKVDELLHIGRAMRRIVLQSVLGGMALSVLAMGFAAAGYITPVFGALLQEGIDVLAIVNALRLIWGPKIKTDI